VTVQRRLATLLVIGALGALAAAGGCERKRAPRPSQGAAAPRRAAPPRTPPQQTPAKKPPAPQHATHEHPHGAHPHDAHPHHHHPHPHPHLDGPDGHHHPY
jgi:hypothetical protein